MRTPTPFPFALIPVLFAVACDGCVPAGGPDAGTADAGPIPAPTTLALNELMSRNDSVVQDSAGDFDDWVELYNLTDEDIDLAGYTLADSGAEPTEFQAGAVVPANGFLLVFLDDTPEEGSAAEPHFPFKLGGAGDALFLRLGDELVDAITAPELDVDVSFGRLPDGAEDPVLLGNATPGASNTSAGEGEGEGEGGEGEGEACRPPPTVLVNEVLVDNSTFPDEQGEFEPWIELMNVGASDVSLDGVQLSDDEALVTSWPLPAQTLASGAYLVVFADDQPEQGALHTGGFALDGSDTVVALADACGDVFYTLPLAGNGADVSVGLFPDGNVDDAGARATPTPGAANVE